MQDFCNAESETNESTPATPVNTGIVGGKADVMLTVAAPSPGSGGGNPRARDDADEDIGWP